MDTVTGLLLNREYYLPSNVLTFSSPFLHFSSQFLVPLFARWNSVSRGSILLIDLPYPLSFYFSSKRHAFPRRMSVAGRWKVISVERIFVGIFYARLCLPLCGTLFICFFFFFIFFGGYFILVSTCRRWRKLKFRSDENSAVRQNGSIYSAGREKCPAGPSTRLIRPGPIKLSAEINLPLVCYPVIVSSSVWRLTYAILVVLLLLLLLSSPFPLPLSSHPSPHRV